MFATNPVLLVGVEGVVIFEGEGKAISRSAYIPWKTHDLAGQLSLALRRSLAVRPVYVLFNDEDQTYRKEENISAADVHRRLEAAFPNFATRALLEVAPQQKVEPNNSAYLFVAMPDSARNHRLGHALWGAGITVAGCGMLPVESTGLVDALARNIFTGSKKSRWAILSGQHETAGLRHVAIRDGQLALTRIIPVKDTADQGREAWAGDVISEMTASIKYLRRFGYEDEDGMDIMIVCDEAERPLFDPNVFPRMNVRCLTASEALQAVGYGPPVDAGDHFADALYAAWMERTDTLKLPIQMGFARARA